MSGARIMFTKVFIVICTAAVAAIGATTAVANTGWLSSYNYTFLTADVVYRMNENPLNDPASTKGTPVGLFNGANLGTYDWLQPNDLFLNSEISAWADGGDTYNNFSLWYRVYFSGTGTPSPGSFTQVSAASISNYGGNNFRGFAEGVNLEQIAEDSGQMGLFTVETYLSRNHTWTGGSQTNYLSTAGNSTTAPTGNYFTATFVATPEPSTYVMAAFGAAFCGLQAFRRRRSRNAGR